MGINFDNILNTLGNGIVATGNNIGQVGFNYANMLPTLYGDIGQAMINFSSSSPFLMPMLILGGGFLVYEVVIKK